MIQLTDRAIHKVMQFAAQSPGDAARGFRVYIQAGGCSGYSYKFKMDDAREGDTVIEAGEIRVFVDPKSLMLLDGCTVDYVESLAGSAFKIDNPNAKGSCGCGESFTC
jgi:iron-sulfur cluster assembly accessory protein